ncbi:MAG: CHAD domain-containing protein [Candidatus Thiodiazotropha sp. (ex Notomyrtea botanica)]|nr:CHAD domain-containing protein [Candidatus Thiodiazotropha sp. (ex Notomyrtea botanica)]
MTPQPISYLLPDALDLESLKAHLAEHHALQEDPGLEATQVFYDSFDWRVWQAGGELVVEENPQMMLCWINRKTSEEEHCQEVETTPDFPANLPQGELHDRLAEALEMRVLLPQVKIQQKQRTLRILDDEEKTVVRVVLTENRYASLDGKQTGELDGRVLLKPLKGYDKDFERLRKQLEAMKLIVAKQSLYEYALIGIGRKPGDYSSKLNYRLDPDARADATAKKIMLSLLDTLEINVPGTKANLDSEFLHDLRVSTRRTRSAMSQIKAVFEPEELEPFKQGLAWIGQVTGPTRDLDVYLLEFDDYQASLPEAMRGDLEPFRTFLVEHHKQAQKELVKKLNSPHFRKVIKSWRAWLNESVAKKAKAPNATRPIASLADQRIHKLYDKVLKDGNKIKPKSEPELLHDLRKDCKKLRYLMEFFQSLYPKPQVRALIKELKIILDNLGAFQDLQVQAESLETLGQQMMEEGAPASALMAMGILVGQLLERQVQAREEFAGLYAAFSSEENRQAFKKLFGGK